MDSPIELPNGRLACGRHGLSVCGICCVDYTFMDDEDPDLPGELDMLSYQGGTVVDAQDRPGPGSFRQNVPFIVAQPRPMRDLGCFRGNGRVYPSKFVPPSPTSTPNELFPPGRGINRFLRLDNPDELLIFTDGSCLDNGRSSPRAGWAFVFKPNTPDGTHMASGRLEHYGPWGDYYEQTSNRAELRAVLAALRFRAWFGEGFTKLVIATDSEYVSKGATEWLRGWIRNGWRTSNRGDVKNRDLWEALLGEFDRLEEFGLTVEFWKIPRLLNIEADRAANRAAMEEDRDDYGDVFGVMV
ncbi:hypothetical protein Neosp_004438 [[Neocosmospora] mangrovei]